MSRSSISSDVALDAPVWGRIRGYARVDFPHPDGPIAATNSVLRDVERDNGLRSFAEDHRNGSDSERRG